MENCQFANPLSVALIHSEHIGFFVPKLFLSSLPITSSVYWQSYFSLLFSPHSSLCIGKVLAFSPPIPHPPPLSSRIPRITRCDFDPFWTYWQSLSFFHRLTRNLSIFRRIDTYPKTYWYEFSFFTCLPPPNYPYKLCEFDKFWTYWKKLSFYSNPSLPTPTSNPQWCFFRFVFCQLLIIRFWRNVYVSLIKKNVTTKSILFLCNTL